MARSKIAPDAESKNVEPQYVEMKVPLYSYGCEKKVKKALKQLKGRFPAQKICSPIRLF